MSLGLGCAPATSHLLQPLSSTLEAQGLQAKLHSVQDDEAVGLVRSKSRILLVAIEVP